MSVIIEDRLPNFQKHLFSVLDDALKDVSADILIKSKDKAPMSGDKKMRSKAGRTPERSPSAGALRASGLVRKMKNGHYRISYGKKREVEYAAAQEAGRAGNKIFRKYTTPGTGAHYLEDTADKYANLVIVGKFKKHSKRARA